MNDTRVITATPEVVAQPARATIRRVEATPTEPPLDPVIRPLRPGEARDVRRIFRATLLLGRPLPIDGGDLYAYESLCLDWYLVHGTIMVAEHDGRVRGYLLACLDQERYQQWAGPRAVRWAVRTLGRIATGELRGDARRFALLRMRDGIEAWRDAPPPPHGAHAHLNLDPTLRAGSAGRQLAAAMDELVACAGLDGWFGEVNAPRGRSLAAFLHNGARVVHRQRNHTFSWLLGRPVDRVTLARPLAGRTRVLDTRSRATGHEAAA